MFPDNLVERNGEWAAKRKARPLPAAESIPLAVVACYDPRLDGMLRPALGLGEGEGFLLRTAGAVVTPAALRSLTLAVYLFDVHQVLVVGHTSCRMADFRTSDSVDAFRRRGVPRQAFGDGDLRTWAGAIANPRAGVLEAVAAIAGAPQMPSDLAVAGAVLDDESGRLKMVFRPGDVPPVGRAAAAPPAAAEVGDAGGSEEEPARPAAGPPPVPPRPAALRPDDTPASAVDGAPLVPVLSVIDDLSKKGGFRQELSRLRGALERETNPVRQLTLLHRFVQGAAAESPEVRRGFELLKREAGATGPEVVSEFILPLLAGRRR